MHRSFGFALLIACSLVAADEPAAKAVRAIVARLDGESVHAAEVEAEFRAAYGERKFSEADRQRLMRAALDQVIDRRLVLAYLTKNGQGASKADVDLELAKFEKELKAQSLSLAQHCERVGLTLDEVRRSMAWKLSWKRYCEQNLSPQNLEKYFQRNHRDFDGTQLRVAQILFKIPADADEAAVAVAKERAAKLRQDIVGGKISFADAAKQRSQSPSAAAGGDIGWIERQRPMPDDFSRVAFALKIGEISEPLGTSFGVHLITLLEEKSGPKKWTDVQNELRPAVVLYLFRWLADQQRPAARIEYVEGK